MIEIDGSQGEGGGQIIRSSLALSAVTSQPIRLINIRARRKKQGLKRQHLTAVQAAAEVCGAHVEGARLGASSLTFEPQEIVPGDYHFRVGTAGSTSLVAQTILPALMIADGPSTLTIEGGTHNPWAPPFDFLQRTFLPQLAKFGPKVTAALESYGFYPGGGGKIRLDIQPAKELHGFELLDRQTDPKPKVTAIVAGLSTSIAKRELKTIQRKSNWGERCFQTLDVHSPVSTGNVILIELDGSNISEIVIGIGKIGVRAEQVARDVWREARAYLSQTYPVGEYLADQLMMPMGLAAATGQTSVMRTGLLSDHSRTQIDVLKMFLDIKISVTDEGDGCLLVKFEPGGE